MFWDEEISVEEENEIIEKIAREFYKYGLETAGIMFLESLKPISRYGSSMGQMVLTPMLPFFGENVMMKGDKAFRIFEKDENIERLIQRLENLAVNGLPEPEIKTEHEAPEKDKPTSDEKKGWRRYLPF